MARNVSRGPFTHFLPSVIHAKGERGNFHLVSSIIGPSRHRLTCTPIPVIYPTFRTQTYTTTRLVLPLLHSNFSMETRGSPWGLWSIHMSSNRRPYTQPTSLSTTGSRALPCLEAALVLIRSPEPGTNRRRSLIYPLGMVAVNYRVLLLMNIIAPYGGFSLKARDQRMEGPQFEQGVTHVSP